MTTKQQPLNSGFTAFSTAAEVIDGIDLSGRTAIITAGHVGLGLETTRALASAGAGVIVGARRPDKATEALRGIAGVRVAQLDLTDPASIDAFAARHLDTGEPVHILANNAGIMGGDLVHDARGYESQFATNHLGHFQLTRALLPALRNAGGARVVNLSSWGHHYSDIRWDDPHFDTGGYEGMVAYGQSKTANVLFAVELDRRWAADGIRGYALHPGGIVNTSLAPWLTEEDLRTMGLLDDSGQPIIDPANDRKTPEQGAATTVFAATSPLLADIGGVYLQNSDIAPLESGETGADPEIRSAHLELTVAVTAYAVDPESAERLWDLSEKMLAT
ncbi:MAG: SDR family NAD(P)-dependent oxidoreductase [Mycobacterium sp.]